MNRSFLTVTSRIAEPVIFASSYMFSLFIALFVSEIIFGKGASLSSNMVYRELARYYYRIVGSYLCNINPKRDPSGKFHELGLRMLQKADNIWCINDKNVDLSTLTPEEKNLLEWRSRAESERSNSILKRSLLMLKMALVGSVLAYAFPIPLGFVLLPLYSSSCGLFLIGTTLAFNSQINDLASSGEMSSYNDSSQLQTDVIAEGLRTTRGGDDMKLNFLEKLNPKRFVDELSLIKAGRWIKKSRACQNVGLCINATGSWLVLGTISTNLIPLVERGGPFHKLVGKIPHIGPAIQDIASDGATRSSVLNARACRHIDGFMRPWFPKAEYFVKFYAKYDVIEAKYKSESVVMDKHVRNLCDTDVFDWVRKISQNIDCACDGREYIVEPVLIEKFCEADKLRCADSFSDMEQIRAAIIQHCSSSEIFKNLAGGLVDDEQKRALIGTARDRFRRHNLNIKPDLGIQFASDMFKNKDHNALVPIAKKASSVVEAVIDASSKLPQSQSPAVPLNYNTHNVNDIRINLMRIKPVDIVDKAQKGISNAKKIQIVDLGGGLFERANQFPSDIFTNGTPEIQILKKVVVPEIVKEGVTEIVKEGVPEVAKNIISIKDGFQVGKLATKSKINIIPRLF